MFPQIWQSCQQKAHETVVRAQFHEKMLKELKGRDHFWKMRSEKCGGDSSESSTCSKCENFTCLDQCRICAPAISGPKWRPFVAASVSCGIATGGDETHWHGCVQ